MFPEMPDRPVVLAELFASVFGQRTAIAATNGQAAPANLLSNTNGAAATAPHGVAPSAPAPVPVPRTGELNVRAGSLFG